MHTSRVIFRYKQLRQLMKERVGEIVEGLDTTDMSLAEFFDIPRSDPELVAWEIELAFLQTQLPSNFLEEQLSRSRFLDCEVPV